MQLENAAVGNTGVENTQSRLGYYERLQEIANKIHAAEKTDEILITLKDSILSLFDADRVTIYFVSNTGKEVYSRFKVGKETKEIRVPISNNSIVGFTVKNGKPTNIPNAYNAGHLSTLHKELRFDSSWDKQSGYVTRQILTVPIIFDKYVVGALQLINKKSGQQFGREDQYCATQMAKVLGVAYTNQRKLANTKKRKTRFDYLLQNNLITEDEMQKAIGAARQQNQPLEVFLVDKMKLKKEDVGRSLGEFFGCPFLPYNNRIAIPSELIAELKPLFLRKNFWVPLKMEGDTATVLINEPNRLDIVDGIKSLVPSRKFEFSFAFREDILKYIELFFGGSKQQSGSGSLADILGKLDTNEPKEEEEDPGDLATENDSAIVQLVNHVITDAYHRGCSDIHIEPQPGKEGCIIRLRIDGACQQYQVVPYQYKRALSSRIKIMSNLDISERRKPQDGKIKFKKFSPLDIELRVATMPTVGNEEDVVMRILASGEPIPLENMGMSPRNYELMLKRIISPYGIFLVVGPTGSGKTTTLHSALAHINKIETKIWTAEDPVEITQRGLRQVQVLPRIGFTFAAAMRSFLRADPDVIMVGEMRDEETVSTGIEASLTGHLVFSTLHTNSAPETITRLLDMGMDPFNFADAILAILAQRLVRTLCKDCKQAYHPSQEEYETLRQQYDGDFAALGYPYTDKLVLYRAKGCSNCENTGYRGRTGLVELLDGTDTMKSLVQHKAPMEELREQAIKDGMTTLMQDGIRKIFLGQTDIAQVRRVCIK